MQRGALALAFVVALIGIGLLIAADWLAPLLVEIWK